MFRVILHQPEIPPNTGNVIRLCANTGCSLHLVRPLGFALDDARLRRAGLDYHEYTRLEVHADLDAAIAGSARVLALSVHGRRDYTDVAWQPGDALLFGSETRGLPPAVLARFETVRIPMQPAMRSLNLSNAVAIVVYEAWRQNGFGGALRPPRAG